MSIKIQFDGGLVAHGLGALAARGGRARGSVVAASNEGWCGGRKEREGEHGESSEAREHLERLQELCGRAVC